MRERVGLGQGRMQDRTASSLSREYRGIPPLCTTGGDMGGMFPLISVWGKSRLQLLARDGARGWARAVWDTWQYWEGDYRVATVNTVVPPSPP